MDLEEAKNYIKVGDFYIDGFGHPVICTEVEIEDKDVCLSGVSLYDASYPREFGVMYEGIEKISIEEAWEMKKKYEQSRKKFYFKKEFSLGDQVLVSSRDDLKPDIFGEIASAPIPISEFAADDYYYLVKFQEPQMNDRGEQKTQLQIPSRYLWKL